MSVLKYLIFLVFNIAYKDGNYKENDMPYFGTTLIIMVYESCIVIIGIFFLKKHVDFTYLSNTLEPLNNIIYGRGILMCALIYPLNHYYFINKNTFDAIYQEFKTSKMNTRKNRIIGYICLIIYWPIMMIIIGHLKYWFP